MLLVLLAMSGMNDALHVGAHDNHSVHVLTSPYLDYVIDDPLKVDTQVSDRCMKTPPSAGLSSQK